MKKFLQKRLNNEKGLTLVELLAVIVILGIIAAIAIPSIAGVIENSRIKAQFADGQNVIAAANIYYADNPPTPAVSIAKLVTDGYLDNAGSFGATNVGTVSYNKGGNTLSATTLSKPGVRFDGATNAEISTTKTKEGSTKVIIVP